MEEQAYAPAGRYTVPPPSCAAAVSYTHLDIVAVISAVIDTVDGIYKFRGELGHVDVYKRQIRRN